jgi:hypothetical protein
LGPVADITLVSHRDAGSVAAMRPGARARAVALGLVAMGVVGD